MLFVQHALHPFLTLIKPLSHAEAASYHGIILSFWHYLWRKLSKQSCGTNFHAFCAACCAPFANA